MIGLLLTLALVGLVVWLIITYIPMPAPFKTVITVVAVLFVILWLIRVLGIADVPIPSLS